MLQTPIHRSPLGCTIRPLVRSLSGGFPLPHDGAAHAARSRIALDVDVWDPPTLRKAPAPAPKVVPPRAEPVPVVHQGFFNAMTSKLGLYGRLLSSTATPDEREYRRALLMIAANQLGDGLIDGGFHVLLDVLGVVTHSLSIVCMVTMSLAQTGMGICGQGYSAIMRDEANELAQVEVNRPEGKARARQALFKSAWVDMACAGALLGCAVGAAFFHIGPVALFAVLTTVKCIQGLNTSYEVGNWYCLRSHLGVDGRASRQKILATMTFAEMATGSALLEGAKWGTYMTALVLSWYSPPLFLLFSIGALVTGVLLTGVPKMCIKLLHREELPEQTPSAPNLATSSHLH